MKIITNFNIERNKNMNHIVIGIEGLVGAGKTSICRELLNKIPNSILLHGGNLYRAIVFALMQAKKEKVNLQNLAQNIQDIDIKELMDALQVRFEIENRETVVYVGKQKIDENELQSQDASLAVSIAGKSANNTQFYIFGKNIIDLYKQKFNVIVSGRDLMNIYPEIDYHFLIKASLEERIKRKCIQYSENADYEKIKANIIERDKLQEESGYYKKYNKTIEIDVTECKNSKESAEKVFEYIKI